MSLACSQTNLHAVNHAVVGDAVKHHSELMAGLIIVLGCVVLCCVVLCCVVLCCVVLCCVVLCCVVVWSVVLCRLVLCCGVFSPPSWEVSQARHPLACLSAAHTM
jgi:hypothetical protein